MKIYILKNDEKNYSDWIKRTNADKNCIDILEKKCHLPIFYISDVKIETANILKQTALSVGCDVSVDRDVITGMKPKSNCLVACSDSQLNKMKMKLTNQPFSLEKILNEMIGMLSYDENFVVSGNDILANKKFIIMGILNVTPDSFYDKGRFSNLDSALKRCEAMIEEGADIIDIGGESSRPASDPVSSSDEMKRIEPVIKEVKKRFPDMILSIDTYKSNVADEALNFGAEIVNDISGFHFDEKMADVVKNHEASCILMHIKGKPKDMQDSPVYENLMLEIVDYLDESIKKCTSKNIPLNKIALDPGIGFGKTFEDNYTVLKNIAMLKSLKRPILIGSSNKKFIGNSLDKNEEERVFGTLGANVAAFMNGARIFRVHNVKENREALKIAAEISV